MLTCQKHLFSLPDDLVYLNCATMSPLSRAVEAAGIAGVQRKSQPQLITQEHFFDTAEAVRLQFAALVNCAAERVALMPSVSYGMAIVAKNIAEKTSSGTHQKIIVVGEEFPSDVYAWDELASTRGLRIETIGAPDQLEQRGQVWNELLLAAIDDTTVAVCISPTHWADGTRFDLVAIGQKCRHVGALLIIDGTQHVGAYSFDIQSVKPDFLICAAYKWLLGPYSSALAYCGPFLDDGTPLEQTWTGRVGSHDFKNLVNYQSAYRPGAGRYNAGEFSNFIQLPMIAEALRHVAEWTPAGIQQYAEGLIAKPVERLRRSGFWVESAAWRASHLFGIRPVAGQNMEGIRAALQRENIFVSYRGASIRVSVHLWNDASDLDRLVTVLERTAH
jgi:selenocysteine lyase/cysteine desulfurase